MPCLSFNYQKEIGPTMPVIIHNIDTSKTGKYTALIDTGADSTCISESVVNELGLIPNGQTTMLGVSGKKDTFLYDVAFGFVTETSIQNNLDRVVMRNKTLQVTQVGSLKGFIDVLIGRDIICEGCFYMSNNDTFSFCF